MRMKFFLVSIFTTAALSGCVTEDIIDQLTQPSTPQLLNTQLPVTRSIPKVTIPQPTPERKIVAGDSFFGGGDVLAFTSSTALRKLEDQAISYSIDATGKVVTLSVDGNAYNLAFDKSTGSYKFADARNSAVSLRIFAATDSLETIYASHTRRNATGTSVVDAAAFFQTIGFLSGSQVANRQTGTATYKGQIDIVSSDAAGPSYGKGNMTLNVNFDTDRLNGGADIATSSPTSVRKIPISRIDIPDTNFANGSATGGITIATSDPTKKLAKGEFGAALFGTQAKGLGGNVTGEIEDAAGTTVHVFQGAFATSR